MVIASTTSATTRPTSIGSVRAPTIVATSAGSSRPAAATSWSVRARSIALRTANGVCRPMPIRSVSVTTPTMRPPASVTG